MAPNGGVSVVITTHDDGEYLLGCLHSVYGQSIPPLQVVVVDDGSTTPESKAGIAAGLAAYDQVQFHRQEPGGPAAARNRGLAECTGDFVAFLDVDDRWRPDNLRIRLSLFDQADVVAAYCGYLEWADDVLGRQSGFMNYNGALNPDLIGRPKGVPGGLPFYLLLTASVRAVGGLDESLEAMEDFDLLIRIGRTTATFRGCNEPLYVRTIRPGSLSRGSARVRYRRTRRFLTKARKSHYFTRRELLRRHLLEYISLVRKSKAWPRST